MVESVVPEVAPLKSPTLRMTSSARLSMSSGIFVYEGTINEAGDEIVLMNKFLDPMTNEWKESRSLMRISADKLHYISYEVTDGEERKMMEITATRKGETR